MGVIVGLMDLLAGIAQALTGWEALGVHTSRAFDRWFARIIVLVLALGMLSLGLLVAAAVGESSGRVAGYVAGGVMLALAGALMALAWGGPLGRIVVTLMGLAVAALAIGLLEVSPEPADAVILAAVIVGSILAGYAITRPVAALVAKEAESLGIWEGRHVSPTAPLMPKPKPALPSGPAWRVIWSRGLPGIAQGGSATLSIQSGQLIVARPGHGRAAAFPIGRARLEQLAGGTYLLSADGDDIAVLEPIDADPGSLIAALRAGTR